VDSDVAAMAANLINTRHLPAGLPAVQATAAEAWAYHRLDPYPEHYFGGWKAEDRGPLPKCLPIARSIVRRGARWLFGQGVQIECAQNEELEVFLRGVWQANRMRARMRARAVHGGVEGGIVLKFAWAGPDAPVPAPISTLSVCEECRLYYHPHDRDRILMARIQYPYTEQSTGEQWYYREEWTDAQEVHYRPVRGADLAAARATPDNFEGWQIASQEANPFGEIPLVHIRNTDTDQVWGEGDLWGLYRVLDRVHLCYHLMDRSNQFDSDTNPIYIDAELEGDDIDKPLQPGQPVLLKSDGAGEGRQAKVQFPPAGNALRPQMMEYARDLRKQVLAAASSSEIDTAEVTNRGNLTQAVLTQLYLPQIEATEDKRISYGEDGIARLLELMARCLARIGALDGVSPDDPESYGVELVWPAYFELTQEERTALTGRLQEQELQGYVTHTRAVREVAEAEGRDPDAVEEELEKEPPPPRAAPAETDPRAAREQMGEELEDADGGEA